MNDLVTVLDIDLTRQDVQALSSADAIAAFFARLGYNTDARTAQTARSRAAAQSPDPDIGGAGGGRSGRYYPGNCLQPTR